MPTETDVQASLPDLELPTYKGVKPQGMKTALTGAGNRISRSHTIGDRVVLVIEAKVKRAGHEDTDDGIVYAEQLKVVDMFEVDDPAAGRLLSTVRQGYREADDARHGRIPLLDVPAPTVDGWTDAAGVAMTDAEVAATVGAGNGPGPVADPARALSDDSLAPVVVVFSDEVRCQWPDDFERGAPRPKPGEQFDEGSSTAFVAQVLDAETGALLGEWTQEEENGRLLALEQNLEAEEVAEVVSTSGEGAGPEEASVETPGEAPALSSPDSDAEIVDLNGPGPAEFTFVDRDAVDIKPALADITDPDQARRLVKAEQAGRGRGLKPRKSVLEMLERHAAKVSGAHPAVMSSYGDVAAASAAAVPPLPGEDAEAPF